MAPEYAFYTDAYGGTAVGEAEWPARASRADAWLMREEALSRMTPLGNPGECRAMAICALADKGAELEGALADARVSSVSAGSVSTSYDATAGGAFDLTPAGRERALRAAIAPWFHVYTGLGR